MRFKDFDRNNNISLKQNYTLPDKQFNLLNDCMKKYDISRSSLLNLSFCYLTKDGMMPEEIIALLNNKQPEWLANKSEIDFS